MRKTNKKSIIAGALALAMVLTGTGYAAWTNTLRIRSTATTGEFEVRFADLGLYAQYGDEDYGWSIVDGIGDKGYLPADFFKRESTNYNIIAKDGSIEEYKKRSEKYNNVTFDAKLDGATPIQRKAGPYTTANTNGSDQITLEINNIYPGYAQTFRTDILNQGTLAAKLSNIKFDVSTYKDQKVVEDMLGVALYVHTEGTGNIGKPDMDAFTLVKSLGVNKADIFRVGGVDFMRASALEKLDAKKIEEALKDAMILTSPATGERMDLFIGIAMDPDLEGKYTTGTAANINQNKDDEASQEKTAYINIDFNWDQFNISAKDSAPANILEKQNADAKGDSGKVETKEETKEETKAP